MKLPMYIEDYVSLTNEWLQDRFDDYFEKNSKKSTNLKTSLINFCNYALDLVENNKYQTSDEYEDYVMLCQINTLRDIALKLKD